MGIFSKYGSFFFALQLLTVIKFIDTIKEIFLAFKLRFIQLICIIGFLLILIFFYANVGFYFLIDEFDAVVDNQPRNYCQTLIECTVTYFNHGVRSGGGIGDVVGSEKFDDMSMYLARWTHDLFFYITVILLLLNMINGFASFTPCGLQHPRSKPFSSGIPQTAWHGSTPSADPTKTTCAADCSTTI